MYNKRRRAYSKRQNIFQAIRRMMKDPLCRRWFIFHVFVGVIDPVILVAIVPFLTSQGHGDKVSLFLMAEIVCQTVMSGVFSQVTKRISLRTILFWGLVGSIMGYTMLIVAALNSTVWMYFLAILGSSFFGAAALLASGLSFDRALERVKGEFSGMPLATWIRTLFQSLLTMICFFFHPILWVSIALACSMLLWIVVWRSDSSIYLAATPKKSQATRLSPGKAAKSMPWFRDAAIVIFVGAVGVALFYYTWRFLLPQVSFIDAKAAGIVLGVAIFCRSCGSYAANLVIENKREWSQYVILTARLSLLSGVLCLWLPVGEWRYVIAILLISLGGNGSSTRVAKVKAHNDAFGHAVDKLSWNTGGLIGSIVFMGWIAPQFGADTAFVWLLPGLVLSALLALYLPLHRLPREKVKG